MVMTIIISFFFIFFISWRLITLQYNNFLSLLMGFPGGSDGQESVCNVGDPGLIPGLGSSPGEGHDNQRQYSCLESPVNRGA